MYIKDIKTILQNCGIETDIYLSKKEESECISIFASGGSPKSSTGNEIEEPSFQVVVRSQSYQTAEKLANQIKNILHGQTEVTVENNRYLSIYHMSGPFDLGETGNGWRDISVNFRCYLEFEYITNRVMLAEEKKTQKAINAARVLLPSLSDEGLISELSARLDAVQESIDLTELMHEAITKTEIAETSYYIGDLNDAWDVINMLAVGSEIRVQLTARLNAVQAEINVLAEISEAEDAVQVAENTEQQLDVNNAFVLVNKIPESRIQKEELLTRLENVQIKISNEEAFDEADTAITQAEMTMTQTDVDIASALVNELPTIPLTQSFIDRLESVQYQIDLLILIEKCEEYTDIAEVSLLQDDIDYAFIYVNQLPQGTTKTSYVNRLNNVQYLINLNAIINEAIAKTEIAENTKTQADVDIARLRTANIVDGNSYKESLNNRLNAVQLYINNNNAMTAVQIAEDTQTQTDVNAALVLLTALSNDDFKEDLEDRIAVVQENINILTATYAVENAESTKTQASVDTARVAVSILNTTETKDALNARLDIIQNIINESHKLKVIIDFGNADNITPNKNGYFWNNCTTNVLNYTMSLVHKNTGIDTGASLTITKAFSQVITNNLTGSTLYPDSAISDAFRSSTAMGGTSTVKISGLDVAKTYRFIFYAGIETDYSSSRAYYSIGSTEVSLRPYYNLEDTVYIDASPETYGDVNITFKSKLIESYISVLEITEL